MSGLQRKRRLSASVAKGQGKQLIHYAQQNHIAALEVVSELVEVLEIQHQWLIDLWLKLERQGLTEIVEWPKLPDETLAQMKQSGRILERQAQARELIKDGTRGIVEQAQQKERDDMLKMMHGSRPDRPILGRAIRIVSGKENDHD